MLLGQVLLGGMTLTLAHDTEALGADCSPAFLGIGKKERAKSR